MARPECHWCGETFGPVWLGALYGRDIFAQRHDRPAYFGHDPETSETVWARETPDDDGPCIVCGAYNGSHDDGCAVGGETDV